MLKAIFRIKYFALGLLWGLWPMLSYGELTFDHIYQDYKKGNYVAALKSLKKARLSAASEVTRYYWMGKCYSKLQNYPQAILAFKKASTFKNRPKELFYEMGQALYAAKKLHLAHKAFHLSYKRDFRPHQSLYYMASISQNLQQWDESERSYTKLLKNTVLSTRLKQLSYYQLAQVSFEKAKNNNDTKELVETRILPLMKKAIQVDPESDLVPKIRAHYRELEKQFNLDHDYLQNGKRQTEKKYVLAAMSKAKYDSDIVSSTGHASRPPTGEGSFVFEHNFFANYLFTLANRFTITPELQLGHRYHTERSDASVFKNDAFTLNGALRTTLEHQLGPFMGSFLLEGEYENIQQDRQAIKHLDFFSRRYSFIVGERLKIFSFGNTAFKFSYSDYTAYSHLLYRHDYHFTLEQTVMMNPMHLLMFYFQVNRLNSSNSPF